jgi:hypothetical protein
MHPAIGTFTMTSIHSQKKKKEKKKDKHPVEGNRRSITSANNQMSQSIELQQYDKGLGLDESCTGNAANQHSSLFSTIPTEHFRPNSDTSPNAS